METISAGAFRRLFAKVIEPTLFTERIGVTVQRLSRTRCHHVLLGK